MEPKIGLITTEMLMGHIRQAVEHADLPCRLEMLAYSRMSELPQLYHTAKADCDGICVTGSIAMEVVSRTRGTDSIPLQSISGRSVEYYQEFFRLLLDVPGVDFRRVLLDSYLWMERGPKTAEDFFRRRFPMEKKREALMNSLPDEMLQNVETHVLEQTRKAIAAGEAELVVCRFSTAYQLLKKEGLPCSFVYPDADNVVDTLNLLLGEIRLGQMNSALPAVIYITAPALREEALQEVSAGSVGVQKCLLEFDQENTTGFLIKRAPGGFEIYSTYQIILRITGGLTGCLLRQYFLSRLGQEISVGYGVGRDVLKARSNALEACAAAQRRGESFAVVENGSLVGPLNGGQVLTVSTQASQRLVCAAERSGLSVATLQRIRSAAELLGTWELTNQDLANALQVSVANANRFLNALVNCGEIHIVSEKKANAKGRPSRIYHLDFME